MQTQGVRTTQIINSKESQVCVQTLLKTGLASITFLRNLFSADNYAHASLTSEGSSDSLSSSFGHGGDKAHNPSSFKVMTLMRGFTEEADRLLDYLENGIFEALQRQYLKSFIFAIYLDPNDPNNLVEAYTFHFTYHTVPGTSTIVPIMSLDDDFERLSLKRSSDPVVAASKNGRQPTLGEVKRSVRSMLRRIIQATCQMEPLPIRRYATFKLFYYPHTPPDYEPPNFRAGDADKDKWFFTTHDRSEVPEKWSVGTLETPFHAVNVRIASVVSHIPSADDNNAPFTGTTSGCNLTCSALSPAQEHALKLERTALQMRDAEERTIVWDAENGLGDEDAEGEDDDEYLRGANGCDKSSAAGPKDKVFVEPMGVRDECGDIRPLAIPSEIEIHGRPEGVPRRVGELRNAALPSTAIEQTQAIYTQTQMFHPADRCAPCTPHATMSPSSIAAASHPDCNTEMDTQSLMNEMIVDAETNAVLLDMETQVLSAVYEDPIQSFGAVRDADTTPTATLIQKSPEVIACECKVDADGDACCCDGGCERWYHLWCMGYHSTKDKRIPSIFVCFDCRLRRDANWRLLETEAYPKMLNMFQDLALFRRAIKIAEHHGPGNVAKFTKLLGCGTSVAAALFKRLENEGFIAPEIITTDELGILETRSRAVKGKGKGNRGKSQRKQIQKPTYSFVQASKKSATYADYFNPLSEVERKLSGLTEVETAFRQRWKPIREIAPADNAGLNTVPTGLRTRGDLSCSEGQALEQLRSILDPTPQSQESASSSPSHPAPIPSPAERPQKRVKISVATAIDLQD